MTFQPIHGYPRLRLSDVVSEQIRAMISSGTLLPGQRLPAERDLAAQLKVSRPSLREALIRLEADGFVTAAGRGGFIVSDVTAPRVADPLAMLLASESGAHADVFELRRELESLSAAYAAERATAADLARITKAFQTLEAAAIEPRRRHVAEHDAAFHRAIADATHNVALTHVMHGLLELFRQSMLTVHRSVDYDEQVEAHLLAQHRAIFDAIIARDAVQARAAAGAHLDYVQTLYRDKPPKTKRPSSSRGPSRDKPAKTRSR